jgi:site-specific DNA-methyltransferase (adenine-specific)
VLGLLRGILELRGSLYIFTSPQMLTRVDVAMRAQFHVLANITWQKPGANGQVDFEMLRTYWTRNNERIVFAEQRGEGLRPGAEEHRARAGLSRGDVNRALNTNMAGHWFSSSQWALPTEAHYLRLRELFNAARAADGEPALDRDLALLQREADVLRREYNELKREYEALRRPFNLTKHDKWGRSGGSAGRPTGSTPRRSPCR